MSNKKFPQPTLCNDTVDDLPAAPGCTLVSGQCHGFPVHKEDVSTCNRVTTENLLFRRVLYGAPVMLHRPA